MGWSANKAYTQKDNIYAFTFKVYNLLYTLLDWYKRELRDLSAMKNETNGPSQVIRVSASCNITFL